MGSDLLVAKALFFGEKTLTNMLVSDYFFNGLPLLTNPDCDKHIL